MSDPHHRVANSIPELDQALAFHVQRMDEKLDALAEQLATASAMHREDMKEFKAALALMVTSAELDRRLSMITSALDAKIKAVQDDLERNKPGTVLKVFTAIMAAISVSGAVLVMLQEAVRRQPAVQQAPQPVQPTQPAPKTP